jgi:hypothetical protein
MHVYQFYQQLMGAVGEVRVFSLAPQLWPDNKRLYREDNEALELTFTPEELEKVLLSRKVDSAPGRMAC